MLLVGSSSNRISIDDELSYLLYSGLVLTLNIGTKLPCFFLPTFPFFFEFLTEHLWYDYKNLKLAYHPVSLKINPAFYHLIFRHLLHIKNMFSFFFKLYLLLNFPCFCLLFFILSLLAKLNHARHLFFVKLSFTPLILLLFL